MKTLLFAFLVLLPGAVSARDDDRFYNQPDFRRYEQPVMRFGREAVDGAARGNFIQNPTFANLVGNIVINFTPAAWAADTRDFFASIKNSYDTGFKSYKADVALAAVGFIPVLGETKKFQAAYKAGKEARILEALGDLSLVRKTLPNLELKYAEQFVGGPIARTFKKGEVIYRTPADVAELPLQPGRWFGTRAAVTSEGADKLYNSAVYGNPNSLMRKYEFKQDVTVYYGRVKDGSGYQAYLPTDIDPSKVLKWTGYRELRK